MPSSLESECSTLVRLAISQLAPCAFPFDGAQSQVDYGDDYLIPDDEDEIDVRAIFPEIFTVS